jgi:hypothetical protein
MKLSLAIFLAAVVAASAQDFTSTVKTVTWTNAVLLGRDPTALESTATVMRVEYDGSRWRSSATLQGTNSDGSALSHVVRCDVGQAQILRAANDTAGITMDANASNVLRRIDRIVLRALQRDANKQLDSTP